MRVSQSIILSAVLSSLCLPLLGQGGIQEGEKRALNYGIGACIGLTSFALPKEYAAPVLASSLLIKLGIQCYLSPSSNQRRCSRNKGYFRRDDFVEGLLRGSIVGSGMVLLNQYTKKDKGGSQFEQEVSLS